MKCHRVPCCLVTALYKHCLLRTGLTASNVIASSTRQEVAAVGPKGHLGLRLGNLHRSHGSRVKLCCKALRKQPWVRALVNAIRSWTLTLLQVDLKKKKKKRKQNKTFETSAPIVVVGNFRLGFFLCKLINL